MIQILHFIVKQKYEDVTVTLNKYWRSDSPLADALLTILGDERGLQDCMSVKRPVSIFLPAAASFHFHSTCTDSTASMSILRI